MRYTALIFDMGDIFFDATAWRRSLTERLQSLGVEIDYPQLCERWETKLVPVYLGRREYWEAFREFLGELGLAPDALAEALAFARRKAAEVEHRKLFDGVAETLAALKARGLKLAVLSDTESSEARVRRRLVQLGIEQHFDAVLTSVDIGHVKPQPAAYAAALARLQVPAAEAAFVGHDVDELDGARQSGLTAVAFNHEDGVIADYYVEHFRDLLPLTE
jgi:HAD superfamily hydrolase (TIGR01509 family)